MYRICVLTGTRAEYGLLRALLFKLKQDEEVDLRILVTGAHLSEKFGNTQSEIAADGFSFDRVPIPIDTDSRLAMAADTGIAMQEYANYLTAIQPDLLILLGDRYEAFAAAASAYILSIPIAHISGGDVTEGALDDGFRHCITKMSSLHFPGCADSARRLIQMGEQPSSVYEVGDPGVENCLRTECWSTEQLEENLQFPLCGKSYAVVTFHPVTQEEDTAVTQVKALIAALDRHKEMQFIITTANADAGGRAINAVWETEKASHENWHVVQSLGLVRYLSAVKGAKAVIGNSSSGLFEAPVFGVPTVNIGDRQKGRPMADCVLCCAPETEAIAATIDKAITPDFQAFSKTCESPFGKGNTSSEIVRIVKEALKNGTAKTQKSFYDIQF